MDGIQLKQEAGDTSELFQAGRDMVVNKNPTYLIESVGQISGDLFKPLIEAYKAEIELKNTNSTGEFIDKLNFFMQSVDHEFLTLEQKLEAGGFTSDIALARKLKQNYSMTLQKIKHISSAQKIHAYLLGEVMVNFSYVYHYLHKKNENRPDVIFIKGLIEAKVVAPVQRILSSADNALELYSMEIHSMIYYLTGNCHINWS